MQEVREHTQTSRTVYRREEERAFGVRSRNGARSEHSRHRVAVAHRLAHRENVRHKTAAIVLVGPEVRRARTPEAHLHLTAQDRHYSVSSEAQS